MENQPNRPLRVTLLTVFVLSITSWNAIRAYSTITNWDILREFGALPGYIMGTGLAWAIAGLWLMYLLLAQKRLAVWSGLTLSGLYLAWYWFDRMVMQPAPAPNLVFSVVVSVSLWAMFVFGLLWARNFFEN